MWYAATVARRANLDFEKDILFENLLRLQDKPSNYLPAAKGDECARKGLREVIAIEKLRAVETFDSYQQNAARSAAFGDDPAALVPYLAKILRKSGRLLDLLDTSQSQFSEEERQQVMEPLGDVMWYVAGFATLFGLDLGTIAESNAEKAWSIFAPIDQRIPTRLHDDGFGPLEQFPRRFNVDFVSIDDETAIMLVNGMRLGDPLKDNAYRLDVGKDGLVDGYRFHDCVHLAFIAILGWSPVVRSLMKRKRKSKRDIDDAEDGARAQIVEEMIVKLTHSYAVGIDRNRLLNGKTRVSVDLLKQIQTLTEGLEVETNKLWEWEKAILCGYDIFDQLRRHKRGRISVDLRNRAVSFSNLAIDEGEDFPEPT